MAFAKKADEKINKLLKEIGIDREDYKMFVDGDLDVDCNFRESWFLLSADRLTVVFLPSFTGVKTFSGYPHKEDYIPPSPEDLTVEHIPLDSITRLFAVDLAAGVLLCGEIEGVTRRLAVFFGRKDGRRRKILPGL